MARSWRSPRTRTRVVPDRRKKIKEDILEFETYEDFEDWLNEQEAADALTHEPSCESDKDGAEGAGGYA